ncbi:MAG: hypothetical protein CMO01_04815 [Thalassobius sp.]|nr:hypothetical protein [Thalassovita sp.]
MKRIPDLLEHVIGLGALTGDDQSAGVAGDAQRPEDPGEGQCGDLLVSLETGQDSQGLFTGPANVARGRCYLPPSGIPHQIVDPRQGSDHVHDLLGGIEKLVVDVKPVEMRYEIDGVCVTDVVERQGPGRHALAGHLDLERLALPVVAELRGKPLSGAECVDHGLRHRRPPFPARGSHFDACSRLRPVGVGQVALELSPGNSAGHAPVDPGVIEIGQPVGEECMDPTVQIVDDPGMAGMPDLHAIIAFSLWPWAPFEVIAHGQGDRAPYIVVGILTRDPLVLHVGLGRGDDPAEALIQRDDRVDVILQGLDGPLPVAGFGASLGVGHVQHTHHIRLIGVGLPLLLDERGREKRLHAERGGNGCACIAQFPGNAADAGKMRQGHVIPDPLSGRHGGRFRPYIGKRGAEAGATAQDDRGQRHGLEFAGLEHLGLRTGSRRDYSHRAKIMQAFPLEHHNPGSGKA